MDTQPQLPQTQSSDQSAQHPLANNAGQSTGVQPGIAGRAPSEQDNGDTGLSEQDRQYIDKAIAAVEDNAGDPYAQNKAINEIKAEYLKERFDKQINSDA